MNKQIDEAAKEVIAGIESWYADAEVYASGRHIILAVDGWTTHSVANVISTVKNRLKNWPEIMMTYCMNPYFMYISLYWTGN